MNPHLELLRASAKVLERALSDYQSSASSEEAKEFYELRVQAAIFSYDVCRSMVSLWVTKPNDFALSVSLKDIVLKLYEYDVALSTRLVNRILKLARSRGMDIPNDVIKKEREKWRGQIAKLQRWSDLRNEAAGHYGKDIGRQVKLISDLNSKDVMSVATAFLSFNNSVCKVLVNIGRGKAST